MRNAQIDRQNARAAAERCAEEFEGLRAAVSQKAAAEVEEWVRQQWHADFDAGGRDGLAAAISEMIAECVVIQDSGDAAECAFDEDGE